MQELQVVDWKRYTQVPMANPITSKDGWSRLEDVSYTDGTYDVVTTVGFKVKENDTFITLANSIHENLISGITSIYKRNIISSKLLGTTSVKELDKTAYTEVIPNKIKSGNLAIGTNANITRPTSLGKTKLEPQKITTVIKPKTEVVKPPKINEQSFIEAYNNGLTYEELAEFFEVSTGTISAMRSYCVNKGTLIPRGKGYNLKGRTATNPAPKLHKLRQYVKDNYMTKTYAEMAQEYGTSMSEIQSTVDGLERDKIIKKWGKPFHGTVCINRDPLIAYGVDVDEWCKCFQTMQDWQMVMRFKVPQSSVRPISDAILQHYPNGREMLYPERKSKLF